MTLKAHPATAGTRDFPEEDVRPKLVRTLTETMTTGQQALECAIQALEQGRTDIAVRALSSAAKAVSTSADAMMTLHKDPGSPG